MAKYKKLKGSYYRKENGVAIMYNPGDIVEASEEEILKHDPQMKTWELVPGSDVVEKEKKKLTRKVVVSLEKVAREDGEGFDVVNKKSNKILNTAPLSEEEADGLLKEINASGEE